MKTYTVKQVSEILGVLEITVRSYIKKGLLVATKKASNGLRKTFSISESDLQAFIKQHK